MNPPIKNPKIAKKVNDILITINHIWTHPDFADLLPKIQRSREQYDISKMTTSVQKMLKKDPNTFEILEIKNPEQVLKKLKSAGQKLNQDYKEKLLKKRIAAFFDPTLSFRKRHLLRARKVLNKDLEQLQNLLGQEQRKRLSIKSPIQVRPSQIITSQTRQTQTRQQSPK